MPEGIRSLGCERTRALRIRAHPELLSNLPLLRPDETLYSWCAHAHAWNGGGDPRATSVKLFGTSYAALCHDFPSKLIHLSSHYRQAGFDVRRLALHHTLLGYFLALQPAGMADEILRRVIGGSMPSIKMRLGITASRVGGHHPLKACSECVNRDADAVGFAYWHVEHQYPSTMACARHARPLFIAWDPVTPVHRRGWLLPEGGLPWERIEIPVRDDRQLDQLIRLAEFSDRWAASEPAKFDPQRLAACYQRGLRDRGLATAGGSLRIKNLIGEIRQRYRGIEDITGFEALNSITPDWAGLIGSVARRSPRHAHPLKHLLMIALVYDTWEDFERSYRAENTSPVGHSEFVLEAQNLASDLAALVRGTELSISAAARRLGISTTTATQIARRTGLTFTPRRKLIKGRRMQQGKRPLVSSTAVAPEVM
ncbi:MAG: hypothetical protein EPN38_11125 [Rhodanobacteraceae bacterium]|nr:MAG: hypothetical protein EPN38_11125 [Rhodanobacteraceae bacterium]